MCGQIYQRFNQRNFSDFAKRVRHWIHLLLFVVLHFVPVVLKSRDDVSSEFLQKDRPFFYRRFFLQKIDLKPCFNASKLHCEIRGIVVAVQCSKIDLGFHDFH